jgi:hypothetical protein
MHIDQSELHETMRENDIRYAQLRGAYSDLMFQRSKSEELMSDGSMNVSASSLYTETAHFRQRLWYIIAVLTLVLFSRFAIQSNKSATNLTNTIVLITIIILFSTMNASVSVFSYTWISMLLSMVISLIVILYIGFYIIHR